MSGNTAVEGEAPGVHRFAGWAAVVAVLAVPFAITAYRFPEIFDRPRETLLLLARGAGMLAAGFVFLEILTGAFRPLLGKLYPAATLHRLHIVFGVSAFGFALSHLSLLIPVLALRWGSSSKIWFLAGPIAALLLMLTIATALWNRRFRSSWRLLHLANYVVLALVIGHALVVGRDGSLLALRIFAGFFAALAALGLIYRASTPAWRAIFRKRRAA